MMRHSSHPGFHLHSPLWNYPCTRCWDQHSFLRAAYFFRVVIRLPSGALPTAPAVESGSIAETLYFEPASSASIRFGDYIRYRWWLTERDTSEVLRTRKGFPGLLPRGRELLGLCTAFWSGAKYEIFSGEEAMEEHDSEEGQLSVGMLYQSSDCCKVWSAFCLRSRLEKLDSYLEDVPLKVEHCILINYVRLRYCCSFDHGWGGHFGLWSMNNVSGLGRQVKPGWFVVSLRVYIVWLNALSEPFWRRENSQLIHVEVKSHAKPVSQCWRDV